MEKVSDMKSVMEGSTSGSRKRYPASFARFLRDYRKREEERKKNEKPDTTTVTYNVMEHGPRKHPYTVFITEYVNENYTDNKPLSDIYDAGDAKWASLSRSERAPYIEKSDLKYVEVQFKKENEELVEALEYYKNRYGNKHDGPFYF